jgi:23S rRNA (cytosine1962-C5)-methyltransferase
MQRARIWPDFRQAWVIYEDEDLLVVDKPAGVSCQAADPDLPDDLVTRLRQYLARREAAAGRSTSDVYIGVHQRLDSDTSGVLVYARRKQANASLASQFEGRRVSKTYAACVTGWPSGRTTLTLKDWLAPGHDGRMQVVRAGQPGAREAITHVRLLAQSAERSLLELTLDTGRTHQARVQLEHAGAPVAGDAMYGGTAAPRLMLHARGLGLLHPHSQTRLEFVAPDPPEFERWLRSGQERERIYESADALSSAFDRAVERRWGLGRRGDGPRATTAFRLINEDGDGLPGLALDVYDRWLVAQIHDNDGPLGRAETRELLLDRIHALGFDGVYLKIRPKQANVVDTRSDDVAPALPVRGLAAPDDLRVLEEGLSFRVRLGDGLSTGLFLDQRANRRRVREMAKGKRVANLFSYTCGFTVAAALGGATSSVSVDASLAALARGRDNLEDAGIAEPRLHAFIAEDVFAWLPRAVRRGEAYDVVVVDPPSYSSTRSGRFVAESDYGSLAEQALALVAPAGRLLACTNHRGITKARFRRILHDACRRAKRVPTQVKDLSVGSDFPAALGEEPHVKSVLVTLSE